MKDVHALLVDDDEVSNFIFKKHMKVFHPKVSCTIRESARKGLDYLGRLESDDPGKFPDVIFLDLWMPEMNGLDFLKQYEETFYPKHPGSRVFLISKGVPPEVIRKAKGYPFFADYLEKPVLPTHLSKAKLN